MVVTRLDQPLEWTGPVTSFMQELCHDWHGKSLQIPAHFGLVEDPHHLWLIASREQAASPHPTAGPGDFQAGLWRHDVAELFVAAPDGSGYLEFNLSPTGAWWLERFGAPREARPLDALPEVMTHGSPDGASSWSAALAVPLDWLRETIAWGPDSRLNVCMILDSPKQRFLTATDLGPGEPDFHRPERFDKVLLKPAAGA